MTSHFRASLLMNFRLCFLEVKSHKTRSFISSFGVFLGVATLLLMFSFLRGIRKDVNQYLDRMGGLSVIKVEKQDASTREEKLIFRRSPGLKLSQFQTIAARFPEIDKLLPEASTGRTEFKANGQSSGGRGVAVSLYHMATFDYQIATGRAFSQSDFSNQAKVCIIGNRLAGQLFPRGENPLGKRLTFGTLTLEIIGTLYTENRFDRRSRECLFPFPLYISNIGGSDPDISLLKMKLKPDVPPTEFAKTLHAELIAMHRGVEDFEVVLSEDKMEEQQETDQALVILLWAVAILSLVLGGISITNIMFASLGDRIREIGLHKALGATRLDLFLQFIIESILLCVVGGLPGMALGSLPAALPEGLLPIKLALSIQDYFFSVGCVVFIGFFSGIFPALKAAKMPPIEALQYA